MFIPPPRDGHEDMLPLSHWPCGDALDHTAQYGCMYDARGILLVDLGSSFFAIRLGRPLQLGPVRHFTAQKIDMAADSDTGVQ
jgi:hypothetical protein